MADLLVMRDELDPVLLARWLADRLDPRDERALAAWLAADPAREARLEELRALWRLAGDDAAARDAAPDPAEELRWASISGRLKDSGPSRSVAEAPPEPRRGVELAIARPTALSRFWPAAAAAVLMVGVGATLWRSAERERREAAESPPPMRAYETARGERAEFRLRDGTRVMLSVASRLRVPVDFGEGSRTVFLEGGAYFDVVHDESRPFVVHGGDLVALDLGTEFVVSAYPEDRHARVVVRSGKVALRPAASADTATVGLLEPGQAGRLDSAGTAVIQPADTAAEFAWTGGTLVLDGMALADALPVLGRWFDLEFRLADPSLDTLPVAATLTNRPTGEALEFLAGALGLRAEQRGRVVTLHRGGRR